MRGAAGLVWPGCLLVVVAASTSPRPGPTQPSPTTWDPTAWRPPSSVAVPTMSEAEMATRRLAELQTMADIWGIKPARTLPLERWTLPDERAVPVSACLREAGWEASVGPNGELRTTVEEPQRTAQRLARYDCAARFSVDPRFLAQPNEQMYAAVWAYSKDYGIPCLAHFGIKPDEPLPTRETYIATRGRFYLYPLNAQVPDTVQSACPQLPPTRAMFGLR